MTIDPKSDIRGDMQLQEAERQRMIRDDWFVTYTGRRFSMSGPRWDEVDIVDITLALARQARFNGHTSRFYSVAQHSVLVSRACPEHLRLHGLLHDAGEAYIGDIVRPLKLALYGGILTVYEERINRAVATRFKLGHPLPAEVHEADALLLQLERRDLLPDHADWPKSRLPLEKFPLVEPVAPSLAAIQFAKEFVQLTGDRESFPEEFFVEQARIIP